MANSKNKIVIDKRRYERFFEVEGGNFLVASLYLKVYADIGVLIISKNSVMSVYLKKRRTQKTRNEGLNFFKERLKTEKYCKDFEVFLRRTEKILERILLAKIIRRDKIQSFFNLIKTFFDYYRWTEFFYTDFAYQNISRFSGLIDNLRLMELAKNKGRSFLNRLFLGSNSFIERLLKKISVQCKITKKSLYYLSHEEVTRGPDFYLINQIYQERKGNYIAVSDYSKNIFHYYNNVKILGKHHNHKKNNKRTLNVIKGRTACGGKVFGYARKIGPNFNNYDKIIKDIEKMQPGEILVSESASPDLSLACRKASAIITNQGGVGSHAAIVSREMSIPCIVGTYDATKIINTGDYLFVDGDKGEVKILRLNR